MVFDACYDQTLWIFYQCERHFQRDVVLQFLDITISQTDAKFALVYQKYQRSNLQIGFLPKFSNCTRLCRKE